MPRASKPIVKRNAIFVKEKRDGQTVYVQRPYDIVELVWGDANPNPTYIQPHFNSLSKTLRSVVYDDMRFYDIAPEWDLIGRGSDL